MKPGVEKTPCAVKMVKTSASPRAKLEFLNEASVMKYVLHFLLFETKIEGFHNLDDVLWRRDERTIFDLSLSFQHVALPFVCFSCGGKEGTKITLR